MAGCAKLMERLWVSLMEDKAIWQGFADLKPGRDYDGLHQVHTLPLQRRLAGRHQRRCGWLPDKIYIMLMIYFVNLERYDDVTSAIFSYS